MTLNVVTQDHLQMNALYMKGMSLRSIAKRYNTDHSNVRRWVNKVHL